MTDRAVRCTVVVTDKHGVNRCESEASDPLAAVPLCTGHLVKIVGDLASLPGIEITVTAQPTERNPS